ncbi:MAG: SDR family oxidoreductase [bacterium]
MADVVVITGAAGGIGAALARRFADDGAAVALLDRDADGVERVASALRTVGHVALGLGCDITDRGAVDAAFARIHATLGPVTALINNAGLSQRSLFADTDPAVLRTVMEVNFFGAVHCTQAALPDLKATRGVVAAVSSVAGFAPLVGRTGYAASKHALHGLFDSLRAELVRDGVAVLLVCPAYVATGIDQRALDAHSARLGDAQKATIGRLATPEAVADAIARAVHARRRQVVLTPVGKLAWWLTRFAPALYEPLMRRSTRADHPALAPHLVDAPRALWAQVRGRRRAAF